jgi:transposase InsO family protein
LTPSGAELDLADRDARFRQINRPFWRDEREFHAGLRGDLKARCRCVYDNAAMESFWSTLKTDTGLDKSIPASRHHAELAVFDYIETFYNTTRRHSSLGQISPVAFENKQKLNDIKAA